MEDETLDVTLDHVMILRNAGPLGGPGMPEWGLLPIPTKLLKQGVRDMLRISDARMSGTSYGACVLHVSPESYVGGPLALVRNGDQVSIDIPARTITLAVSDAKLAARRAAWRVLNADMAGCSAVTSVPPTKAAISIFWKRRSVRQFPNPTSIDRQGGEPWDARRF